MKRTPCLPLLSGVVLVAALSSLAAQMVVIGPGVRNGDFNDGTADTFADNPPWFNLGGGQGTQAARTNVDYDGTRNAVGNLNGTRIFGNDTLYDLVEGDVFDLSYVWRDASNWNDALDQVEVVLFTTDDDSLTGVPTVLVTDLSGISTTNSTYEEVDHKGIYTATAGDAGKRLFVQFQGLPGGDNTGFYRLDNFFLAIPADPVLNVVSGDYAFGDVWHPAGTDTTIRTVTFKNEGVDQSLTVDAVTLTDDGGGIFSITDAPSATTVIAPGETFDVEITATGGGGGQTLVGELLVDVSHAASPANDQDQILPLTATISTTGDPYSLVTNGSLDGGLAGWTGGSVSVDPGIVSGRGARVRGIGDDRTVLTTVFADSLSQVFGYQSSPDFTLSCSIAIPDFATWTGVAPTPNFYDRSFQLAVLADTNTPGGGDFTSAQNATTLINLFYFPGGIDDGGGATPAGFYLYDGTAGAFVQLPALGTMMASVDADDNGILDPTSGDTVNAYGLTIAGTGFGTGSASYVISLTDPMMATVSTPSLTTSHGTAVTAGTAKAVVFTTSDSPTDSVTNPATALQTSFWVDEISASITPTLPLALFTVSEAPPIVQALEQSRRTFTFSVRNDGQHEDLTLSNPVFSDPRFTLLTALPASIAGGDTLDLEVAFDSRTSSLGSDLSATLTLDTNDAIQAQQVLGLHIRLLASPERILIDYDDGIPGNGIHELAVRSGGFEENTLGDTFAEADFWTARFPEGLDTQLVFDLDPALGSLHGSTSGWVDPGDGSVRAQAFQLIPMDEWVLGEGDQFDVEVTWRDDIDFDPALGQLQVVMEVFTPDGSAAVNDPANGENNANRLITRFELLDTPGTYQTYSVTTPLIQPGSPWIGNRIGIRFFVSGGTNDRNSYAMIDNVSLVAHLDAAPLVLTNSTHDPATGAVTLRWVDSGRVYKIQSAPDLTFGAGTVEFPVDGTADTTTYPGEIEFAITDAAGVAPGERYWRVVAE